MPKISVADRDEARHTLRALLAPGDVLYTVLRHVSRSGMRRAIDVYKIDADSTPRWLSPLIARATGYPFSDKYEALIADGCGMDMGFEIVYNLGRVLYPEGFTCPGETCQSDDHSNGDRDRTPHHYNDGGYAFRHRWL